MYASLAGGFMENPPAPYKALSRAAGMPAFQYPESRTVETPMLSMELDIARKWGEIGAYIMLPHAFLRPPR